MTATGACRKTSSEIQCPMRREAGFCLAELLVASIIIILVSTGVLEMLDSVQRGAARQAEIHAVMDSTRTAVDAVSRVLRQAGNDPTGAGFEGVIIADSSQVRVLSDLTGSLGPGNPDKGDPDGDTLDSGEDITIRFNAAARSIEFVPSGGPAQTIAANISALVLEYLDASGAATSSGSAVRSVRIALTGESQFPDPETGRVFRLPVETIVQLAARGRT